MKKFYIPAFALLLSVSSADASDIVLGIGYSDIDGQGTEAATFQFEYHTDPIREYHWGNISGMAVAQADSDGDVFVGVGVSTLADISKNWFFEGSFAAGYYENSSNGTDLGGNFQFRTLIGLGYKTSASTRISIAIDHVSNAGIESSNPGSETLSLRYRKSF